MAQGQDNSRDNAATALRDEYQANGFVGPLDILTPQEAAATLRDFEAWQASLPQETGVKGDIRFKPHLFLPWANRIVRHPKLVEAVQRVLASPDILCWSSDFNIKQAETSHYFSPHQDSTYAGLEPASQVVTAWVALSDPVGEREGCLQFSKGSHRRGQREHTEQPGDADNLLSRGQECAVEDDASWTAVPLRGGQASLHHFHTVHQSGPNRSSSQKDRIGLAIRYMTANVRRKRQSGSTRESATLIAGQYKQQQEHDDDKGDCFDLEPVLPEHPTADDVAAGRRVHADAMRREAANYFASCPQTNKRSYDDDPDPARTS